MITSPQHDITLGGLMLVQNGKPYAHPEGFTTEVSADGTNWGNSEVVVSRIISALSDGDLVSETHVGNREALIHVRISAPTGGILPLGEKALAAVVGKPVELIWQPPDPLDPPTVFDIVHSSMEFAFDDMDELRRQRAYVVRMSALPRGRSASKVVTAAVGAAVTTVLNAASSTSGWSAPGPPGAALSVASGAVVSTYPGNVAYGIVSGTGLRLATTINLANGRFFAVDWKSTVASASQLFIASGDARAEVRRDPLAGGYVRSWYQIPDGVTSVPNLELRTVHLPFSGSYTLSIDQVLQSTALPAAGTTRQLTQAIVPGGSVPSEGDVLVQHASAGLGQTIVYSYPSGGGYSPPLSQWLTSSNTPTPDASTVSGQRISLVTTPAFFDVPVSALPVGDAQLWARVRLATGSAALAGIDYGVRSVMGSTELDSQIITTKFSIPAAGTWVIVPLAQTVLPPRSLGPNGKVRIYLLRSTVHDIELDEAWLFGMDRGRLTVVNCGSGTPAVGSVHNRLRVTAPSLDVPFGRVEVATAADWSDAFVPDSDDVPCDQTGHRFHQDGAAVFTVTSGATAAAVSLEHYRRWHSNAGVVA